MILIGILTEEEVEQLPPRVETGPATYPLSWSWSAPWMSESWHLTNLASPVIKLKSLTGAGQGEFEHWWSDTPVLEGSGWDGGRSPRGEIFMPIMVRGNDSGDFLRNHDAFVKSLDPRQEGVLRITRPDGIWREIRCRYVSGGDFPIDLDPVAACRATYGITWATADPYWSGEPVAPRFEYQAPVQSFFPGPPWNLSSGNTLNNATVINPGDVEAHVIARVEGPYTEFTIGVGEALITVGVTKTAGQWVDIDMRPGKRTIKGQDGADLRRSVTRVQFAPLPPGEVDIVTSLTAGGLGSAVTLSFTPRYRRGY